MATERLPMRHIREILRLKWRLSRSHRETARSLGVSAGVVASVLSRASKLGLTWDAIEALADDDLSGRARRELPNPVGVRLRLRSSRARGLAAVAAGRLAHGTTAGRRATGAHR